ncbi:MAG: hypothetical protein JXR18_03555 [Neptuniibacter sp.]
MDLDKNAARRNLILISVGFITYSFGKGEFSSSISTPIGLTLHDTTILTLGAWLCLFWFLYRYRIYSGKAWGHTLLKFREYLRLYVSKNEISNLETFQKKYQALNSETIEAGDFGILDDRIKTTYFEWTLKVNIIERTSPNSTTQRSEEILLNRKEERFFKYKHVLTFVLNHREFSDYVFPYILFGFALFCGIGLLCLPDMNALEFLGMIIHYIWFFLSNI